MRRRGVLTEPTCPRKACDDRSRAGVALEAWAGIEPAFADLQSAASPLCHQALANKIKALASTLKRRAASCDTSLGTVKARCSPAVPMRSMSTASKRRSQGARRPGLPVGCPEAKTRLLHSFATGGGEQRRRQERAGNTPARPFAMSSSTGARSTLMPNPVDPDAELRTMPFGKSATCAAPCWSRSTEIPAMPAPTSLIAHVDADGGSHRLRA